MNDVLRQRVPRTPSAQQPSLDTHGPRRQGRQDRLGNAEIQARLGQDPQLAQVTGGRRAAPRETPEQRQRREFDAAYTNQLAQQIDPNHPYWRKMSAAEAATYDQELADGTRTAAAAGTPGFVTSVGQDRFRYDSPDQENLPTRGQLAGSNTNFYAHAFNGTRQETVTTKDKKGRDVQTQRDRDYVTTLNADGTTNTLDANDQGMVELPTGGFGFTTHNRDDVQLNGRAMPDQWGRAENIARNVNIAADYRTMFPNSTVSFGDLSDDQGGSPLLYSGNARARHGSHFGGSQADLQYPSGQGSTNRAPTGGNDLFRTNSLVRLAENRGMNNFYAASGLDGELVMSPDSNIGYNRGHDDHLHMGRGRGNNG